MRRIIEANIGRFKNLSKTEREPTKRAMENWLSANEERTRS